tara:strand:- start:31282 stop:32073 length:792 start_codon:yes stop_codon:yes gene_type:complete
MKTKNHESEENKSVRMCGFRAQFLKPLSKIMGKNDVRHYLNGINVQSNPIGDGVIITATDGHRLLSILDPFGYTNGDWICEVSPSLISASVKSVKNKATKISEHDAIVTFNDNGAYVYGGFHDPEKSKLGEMQEGLFLSEYSDSIDGKYPSFGRVFGKVDDSIKQENLLMNADYLKECGEVFLMLGNPKFQGISILGQCNKANVFGLLYNSSRDFDARMVIMPMQNDGDSVVAVPDWINGIKERDIERSKKEDEINNSTEGKK